MPKYIVVLLMVSLLVLAGCQEGNNNDSDNDAEAAQSFFPTLSNYSTHETESIQTAVSAAVGTAAITANPALGVLVERVDTLLSCYREVGAVDAKIYVENISADNITQQRLPVVGALVVINQQRVLENFASCVASSPLDSVFGAQSVEPCTGSGTFEFNGDNITYAYVGSDGQVCGQFAQHFTQYQ